MPKKADLRVIKLNKIKHYNRSMTIKKVNCPKKKSLKILIQSLNKKKSQLSWKKNKEK